MVAEAQVEDACVGDRHDEIREARFGRRPVVVFSAGDCCGIQFFA
jgi:hypothetical protein